MQIVNLFPTAVGMFDLGREFTKEELDYILNQETSPNMGNTTSKNHHILRDLIMKDLGEFFQNCVNTYFENIIAPSTEASIYITQSWVNYTNRGQWHHTHDHPNSILSGVFYVQTDSDDKIHFAKNQYDQISFSSQKWNVYNSKMWWIRAKQSSLILFPSSLQHHVDPVQTDHTRISISFNTFAKGLIGSEESCTGLKIN